MLAYVNEVKFIAYALLTSTLFGVGCTFAVNSLDQGAPAVDGNGGSLVGGNSIMQPSKDYIYEHFYLIALNCYRFVDTVDRYEAQTKMYPKNSPDIFEFDVLMQVHIDVTLHCCETMLDVLTAYYDELKKLGQPVPHYMRNS